MTGSPHLLRVVLWMTGTLLSFCVMAVSIRALSATLSILEMLTLRAAVGLAIIGALLAARPELRLTINRRRIGLHVLRNSIHFGAQYLWALSLLLLPLATVFALEFTMPAWIILLAPLFLAERMTPSRIGVVIFGLVGVLVILRPGSETFQPAALLVLIAALGYAIQMIATKKLTTTESTFAIVFWMSVIQLALGLIGDGTVVRRKTRDRATAAGRRPRDGGTVRAFLPEQRVPGGRRQPGRAARFHAHPADRCGRLVALWRGAGRVRLRRRRPDHRWHRVESAQRVAPSDRGSRAGRGRPMRPRPR